MINEFKESLLKMQLTLVNWGNCIWLDDVFKMMNVFSNQQYDEIRTNWQRNELLFHMKICHMINPPLL